MNEALEEIQEGVKVGGVLVQSIRFADDQVLISHSQRGLQRIMDALQQTSEKYNMRINTKKTKVMRMPGRKGVRLRIEVNDKELEMVAQFCYVGSMVIEDCRSEREIRRRIALAKEAFSSKKDRMCGSLSLQLKKMHSQSICCMEYRIVWK